MTSEPPRPLPQSTVQATGQVASDVVLGLRQQPALLAIVVLNIIAICFAGWFLAKLADVASTRTEAMMKMIQDCMTARHSS
jgi:hypothetical protein